MIPPVTFVIKSVISEDRPLKQKGCSSSMPKLIKKQKNIVRMNLADSLRVNGNRKPKGMVIIIFNTTCLTTCLIKSPRPIITSINGTKFIGV